MTDSRLLYEPELSVTELPFPEDGPETGLQGKLPPNSDRTAPWIEYVAGQWVVFNRRHDAPKERRSFHAMRQHVEKLLGQGWSITGRDPVRLELYQRVKLVRGGVLVDG